MPDDGWGDPSIAALARQMLEAVHSLFDALEKLKSQGLLDGFLASSEAQRVAQELAEQLERVAPVIGAAAAQGMKTEARTRN